ncbi:Outer membrane receptor protein [Erythrobacter litoralis]|uniref:TonB-dependent receptor n=1 Tax=Erythrobacter litoralis TaxID=39960 RepID=A0A074N0E4_9SPHN|nr:TonB-dependent receptor [Erythrobacter litoralis]AOL24128.1 Outer membrane receptor protein [Erythrobacter litoralis]KEO99109.1 TonB-dependent receptor [Erythrobacter litoralis]
MSQRIPFVRALWASTSLIAAAGIGFAAPAAAQDDETAQSSEGELPTIIVTANRREESLQDVAVSADILDEQRVNLIFSGAADTTALAGAAPGLNVESSNGRVAPRFYIRGLGNTDFDLAASQPVSVILDEIVLENVTLKSFPIFDVQRVEVLRGPQGTLFGRNTPAGIVKIETVKPGFEPDVQAGLSFGSLDTASLTGAVGGAIVEDKLAFRVSTQFQRRGDWIDNGFTGEENALGGFTDFAIRGQLLWTPDERSEILAQVNFRDLDGSSTFFRANVLSPGSNELNQNYDRDTVFYDAGGGNPAEYNQFGATLNASYEYDFATLTSITSYWTSEGFSRGDIDGGNLVTGPGFIPFPSDTQDSIDLEQLTHEVRLASNGDGPLSWQVGGFIFDSDFDVTTVGFTFPPPVTVNHTNTAWAVFGQASYELTEALRVTAGLRYTDDEKDFFVRSGAPLQPVSVQDDNIDWDVSIFADVTDTTSVYARVANAFRAPTIQGRDVAFFAAPSVAQSENITSYEAGFKSEFADRKVRINGSAFYYTVEDPQFTAVGGAGNLVQLINANEGEAWGFEFDTAFQPTPNITLTLGLAYNDTQINDDSLAVGVCAQCTVLDPLNANGFALVDGNPFPNAPEWSGDFTARYGVPVGNSGEFFIFTDWIYLGETNFFLYESAEFNADSRIEGGLRIGYSGGDGQWEVALFARNITNEDNILGAVDFNNLTAFVNDPRVVGVSFGVDY